MSVVRLGWIVAVAGLVGCRDYQEPLDFAECQPYLLECALCTYEEDLAALDGLQRAYRCEASDGTPYDVVVRDGISDDGEDTEDLRYYDPVDGYRMAAERRHDGDVDVCGESRDVEWWGDILDDCEDVCELDGSLPGADDSLPLCD